MWGVIGICVKKLKMRPDVGSEGKIPKFLEWGGSSKEMTAQMCYRPPEERGGRFCRVDDVSLLREVWSG